MTKPMLCISINTNILNIEYEITLCIILYETLNYIKLYVW